MKIRVNYFTMETLDFEVDEKYTPLTEEYDKELQNELIMEAWHEIDKITPNGWEIRTIRDYNTDAVLYEV